MINTEIESPAYRERAAHLASPAVCSRHEDRLDRLEQTLTQMNKMISQSVTALIRIEQRLSSPSYKRSEVEMLTSREQQIMKLAATGRINLQIASSLAQGMIAVVQAAQARTWTAEEIGLILRWLTPYPGQPINDAETAERAEALLWELGGPQMAQQRLEQIADQCRQRYPLHSEILRKFLAGWERREIVRHIVGQGLYEDSRIYHCIKELPDRISEHLRRVQAAQEKPTSDR